MQPPAHVLAELTVQAAHAVITAGDLDSLCLPPSSCFYQRAAQNCSAHLDMGLQGLARLFEGCIQATAEQLPCRRPGQLWHKTHTHRRPLGERCTCSHKLCVGGVGCGGCWLDEGCEPCKHWSCENVQIQALQWHFCFREGRSRCRGLEARQCMLPFIGGNGEGIFWQVPGSLMVVVRSYGDSLKHEQQASEHARQTAEAAGRHVADTRN